VTPAAVLIPLALLAPPAGGAEGEAAAAEPAPIHEVPYLRPLRIDGHWNDWAGSGEQLALTVAEGEPPAADDLEATVWMGWTDEGVALLVRVKDAAAAEAEPVNLIYQGDSVEFFVADKRGGTEMIQLIASPGRRDGKTAVHDARPAGRPGDDDEQAEDGPPHRVWDHRKDEELRAEVQNPGELIKVATTADAKGYTIEALIPWETIGVEPDVGVEAAAQVHINDADVEAEPGQTNREHKLVWHPGTETYRDSTQTHRVLLGPFRRAVN